MYNTCFELYWGDLTPEAQKELLNTLGIASVEDTNWDCMPIMTLEAEGSLADKAKEIMMDYLDAEEADDMLDQLRSLRTEGIVTENLYDYITENWDDILREIEENE